MYAVIMKRSLGLMTLLVIAISCLGPANSQAKTESPCKRMGKSVKVGKVSVPTCTKFYPSKPAINFPSDSKTAKYGIVIVGESGSDSLGTLFDRRNKRTSFSAKLVPAGLSGKPEAAQYIFKAKLKKSRVVSLTPVLYVPTSTMVQPFVGTQFLGKVNNFSPADSINDTDLIRWKFDSLSTDGLVAGKFLNLKNSVKMSQMVEPPAPCATSLSQLEGATGWYTNLLGTDDAIYLVWYPAMHTRMDSEYVVKMNGGLGVTYMSAAPTINTLLIKKLDITLITTWTIHGNPVGTPYSFDTQGVGGFPAGFGPQTPADPCPFR
ncbi:MAG: hypothetical protein EBQ72_06005 [Actinobacteria bacterium]|nr:hypothetical protein [Actinomycetota bacterium]